MRYNIDKKWEQVPEWCRPYAWVEFQEEYKARRGIHESFQIDEQIPLEFDGDGIWMVRTLNDAYGVFIRVNEIQVCAAPEGSKEYLENELKKLKEIGWRQQSLSFQSLSAINLERALLWHPGGIEEWTVSDWATAAAGEMGEVCNAVKKLRRLECGVKSAKGPHSKEEAVKEISKEIGDTLLYLDLLAQRLGLSLEEITVDVFNAVSEREGFPQRILSKFAHSKEVTEQ